MTERDPWSDERLAAAFAARAAASPSAAPPGALAATIEGLRTADAQPTSRWARWRWPAATVGALTIGVVVTGAFTLGPRLLGRVGDTGAVSFVPGPAGDVRTLDADEFTFEYPADWVGLDSSASSSDGSSIAVLGTGLPQNDCGTEPIDIDCVRALPLGE
ncbi:MAG TPA: hypothetical protein VD763_11335, partial [Candidatus Saccharimonadales bacterium]|nr:hypothetical protein [Candidatus Saccharimonadales bacterium]